MDDYLERLRKELSEIDTHEDEEVAADEQTKSKTVLKLDNWSHRRGEELHDAIIECGGKSTDKYSAADFFSLAFEPESTYAENPASKSRRDFIETLTQTVEFRDLQGETMLNELQSELAAISFAKQYNEMQEESPEPSEKQIQKRAKSALDDAKDASEEARAMSDATCGGIGGEAGNHNKGLDAKSALQLMQKMKQSRNLREIINKAGRFRRFAQTAQNSKVIVGKDDVTGIELGNDITRLLQSEKMKLTCGIEEIEDLTALRLLQKRCMIRKTESYTSEAKGAVVICVDESGSMDGEKVQEAKAIALAMYWIARNQNRWCCLYGYSGDEEGNYVVLKPNEEKSEEVMEWLSHFYSCGTSCDVPIDRLPEQWKDIDPPKGKTDIIFLTDALVRAKQSIVDDFMQWKKSAQAKLQTVVVGGFSREKSQLHEVSESVTFARTFGLEQSGSPIEELFKSI